MSQIRRRQIQNSKQKTPLVFHATMGNVVGNSGGLSSKSDGFYTDAIPVNAGQTLVFYGYMGANYAVIFKEENNGETITRTKLRSGTGSSSLRPYSYTATENCYLGVSNYTTHGDESATLDGIDIPIIFND